MRLRCCLLHLIQIRCTFDCLAGLHLSQFGCSFRVLLMHILAALMLMHILAVLMLLLALMMLRRRLSSCILLEGCSSSVHCFFDHFGAGLLMELLTAGHVNGDDAAEVGFDVCPHACILFVKGLDYGAILRLLFLFFN